MSQSSKDGSPRPGLRVWSWRLLAILLPLLLLVLLEGIFRLGGVGHPTSFTRLESDGMTSVRVPNEKFGWRFFPRELARQPTRFSYPDEKREGTVRIFILGGSAAMGDIRPIFGVGRCLEMLLRHHYPDTRFEVINAAMTAINSHVVREIEEDVVQHDPDVLVAYLGNNEVVGPFGAGNRLVPFQSSLTAIRGRLFLSRFRIWQKGADAIRSLVSSDEGEQKWRGMEEFLESQIRRGDPELEGVYRHFQRNLEDMIEIAREAGVPLVLGTVAVNLLDCPPFGSLHREELLEENRTRFAGLFSEGIRLAREGQWSAAMDRFDACYQIDDSHAELLYQRGRAQIAVGREGAARDSLTGARDLDTLRFRADSRVNEIIREVVTDAQPSSVGAPLILCDAEEVFLRSADQLLPGHRLFHEHVHLTARGNELLARALLVGVEQALPDRIRDHRHEVELSSKELDRQLGRTAYEEWLLLRDMYRRLERPPFTGQAGFEEMQASLVQEIAALEVKVSQDLQNEIASDYEVAIAATDLPWNERVLRQRYGEYLQDSAKDVVAAAEQYRRVLELDPASLPSLKRLATLCLKGDDLDGARELLIRLVELEPELSEHHLRLGKVYSQLGEKEQANRALERARELDSR